MVELKEKYIDWDKDNKKSNTAYLVYGIFSLLLSLLIYPKMGNLDPSRITSIDALFLDLEAIGVFLRMLRLIVYLGSVYFIFDIVINKANRNNVMKVTMLLSAASHAMAMYILSPLIKVLSLKESSGFIDTITGFASIGSDVRKIKPDLVLTLIIFALIFCFISLFLFFKNKSSQSKVVFELDQFQLEDGNVEPINLKNIKVDSSFVKKIVAPLILVMVLFFAYKVWDDNFNLITINTEEMVNVDFDGIDGKGVAESYREKDAHDLLAKDFADVQGKELERLSKQIDAVNFLTYTLDKEDNLSNGDVVTLTFQANKKELKKLGLKLSSDTIEYTVNSLLLIPKEAADIKNMDDVVSYAKDNIDFASLLPQRNGKANLDGIYFTNKEIYEKETGSIAGASNQGASIGLVFRITGENKQYFGDEVIKIEKYYLFRLDDVLIDGEGKFERDDLEYGYLRHHYRFDLDDKERKIDDIMKTEYGMVKVK